MFMACAFWGLMAPLGKDAMTHGIDGIDMVTFRVVGGCLLFWLTAPFVKHERVPWQDRLRFAGAGLLGLVTNQCCYTIGLSLTSPINAGVLAMLLGLVIVPVVSLFTKVDRKESVERMFKCYDNTVTVRASTSLTEEQE